MRTRCPAPALFVKTRAPSTTRAAAAKTRVAMSSRPEGRDCLDRRRRAMFFPYGVIKVMADADALAAAVNANARSRYSGRWLPSLVCSPQLEAIAAAGFDNEAIRTLADGVIAIGRERTARAVVRSYEAGIEGDGPASDHRRNSEDTWDTELESPLPTQAQAQLRAQRVRA